MAYANIVAEWLVKERQDKAYVPEAPFAYARHLASGRVKCFANAYDGKFGHALIVRRATAPPSHDGSRARARSPALSFVRIRRCGWAMRQRFSLPGNRIPRML